MEKEKSEHQRVLVKGYMRPDGTSYYVVIPKKIRELFKPGRRRVLPYEGKAGKGDHPAQAGGVRRRRAGKRVGN